MQYIYSVTSRAVFILRNNGCYLKLPGEFLSFINIQNIVIIKRKNNQEIYTKETNSLHGAMKPTHLGC